MANKPSDRITRPSDADVELFLDGVDDERRRADAREVLALMRSATGARPRMWGTSIIGFGRMPYSGADGKQREWFAVGLSPRKAALTLYGLIYQRDADVLDLLDRLGPHTTGTGCLYIKRVTDVDLGVLVDLVRRAWAAHHVEAG